MHFQNSVFSKIRTFKITHFQNSVFSKIRTFKITHFQKYVLSKIRTFKIRTFKITYFFAEFRAFFKTSVFLKIPCSKFV